MTKKLVREYVEADAWLSIFSGTMGDHRSTIENAALWADKALKEFEKRYVVKYSSPCKSLCGDYKVVAKRYVVGEEEN